ncbi:hypothetical protein CTV96_09625 [Bacillus altitudinis]|uniref:hypothetical protein n=1 Tax=Bacillus altitudinis TaxID=293387 RepID=UPI000C2507A3|nr:hypothetical protein [Bacillus altitudinis]PJI12396.1 hypothetical protein CTV96_09625 [Bacillus altitudinis]PKQ85590.1 hypothetical protein CTV98_007470 [Bacillus altitudinis]
MHVLKDEQLGVDREYVAVDRNAEVGEKIYTLVDGYNCYDKGEYGVVNDVDGLCVDARFESNYENRPWYINHVKYHVLEPTDIVHIDGERYRLEDRKAEDGEKVIAKNMDGKWPGLVSEVLDSLKYAVTISGRVINGKKASIIDHGYYYVLTPVQDDAEPKESDIITVLANLGAEVAELKRTVARHQAEINALHEDNVRLGEQLAKVVAADDPKALSFTAADLAQVLIALKKAGL